MGFFEDVDAINIIESNIERLLELEKTEQNRVLREFKRIRQELRDRLDTLREDTFTAQQLRGVLVQVESALLAINTGLKEGIKPGAQILSERGVQDLVNEIRTFQREFQGAIVPINLNVALIATKNANFLLNQYDASIDAYSAALRGQIIGQISRGAVEKVSTHQMVRRISQFFMGEEFKLQRIVRTELHNIYNLGKMRSMEKVRDDFIPDLKKTLIHPKDKRTAEDSKILAQINPIIPIDEPFIFVFKGDERRFMNPPDRPNDRAILVPFRSEWDKKGLEKAS